VYPLSDFKPKEISYEILLETKRVRLGTMVTFLSFDLQVMSSNTKSKNSPGCGG